MIDLGQLSYNYRGFKIKRTKIFYSIVLVTILFSGFFLPAGTWSLNQNAAAITPTQYNGTIATVTFAFGHAYKSQLQAMNNLTKYHFMGNISPVYTKIGNSGYLSISQLLTLQNNGWQILSDSMTHPKIDSSTPDSTLQYEIVQSKQNLTSNGFCITGYESPFDIITTNSSYYIQNNYNYAVINPNHQNTVYSISNDGLQWNFPVAIHYYGVGKGLAYNNFTTIKPLIDYAIKNKTYLVLNFHQIDQSTNPYSTYPQDIWQIMKYVHQQSNAGKLHVENSVQALGISCP